MCCMWVDFNQINFVIFYCELDVYQVVNLQFEGQFLYLFVYYILNFFVQGVGWQGIGGVVGVDVCLFDMFYDVVNQYYFVIVDGIDIYFNCIVEEVIQQYWCVVGDVDCGLEVVVQILFVIDDFYCLVVEYIRWMYYQWVVNFFCFFYCLFNGGDGGVCWLFQFQMVNCVLEVFMVFCLVDSVWIGIDNWYVGSFQGMSQFQWGLVVVLDDNVFWFFDVYDFQYVFQGYWFKIQMVGGVVVGRDGFWVIVDYDGFVIVFVQCQ